MSGVLTGKICIVTGASRGIGKGIALQLGEAGATVYITGRTLKSKDGLPGSLEETAEEIEARGGRCVAIQCDHSKETDIEKLFERVKQEQNGQLDLLVNNAYAGVKMISENMGVPFWESDPVEVWDCINNVGLRNHYICAVYASRLMTPKKQGLIVNISSGGGLRYVFNVAYGIGKEAVDRMAVDCAHELHKHNVAFVSLWPGAVLTENVQVLVDGIKDGQERQSGMPKGMERVFENAETPEFSGKCIVKLVTDPAIMKKSGRVLITADLGDEYYLKDVDGRKIDSVRSVRKLLSLAGLGWVGKWIPRWIRLPYWLMSSFGHKF